jgi:UDP-N-acetyl-D-mannosaminuronic acid dehydrogenase
MESRIIAQAREVNNYKSFWCAEKVKNAKLEFEIKNKRKPSIAIMGLAFKPNIDDLRESPAKYIAQRIMQEMNDEELYIVEPNVMEHHVFKLTDYKTAVINADIIAFLVAHDEFKYLSIAEDKVVLDFCGVKKYDDKFT